MLSSVVRGLVLRLMLYQNAENIFEHCEKEVRSELLMLAAVLFELMSETDLSEYNLRISCKTILNSSVAIDVLFVF